MQHTDPMFPAHGRTIPPIVSILVSGMLAALGVAWTTSAALGVDKGEVDAAVRFRESVGLGSDRKFVRSTFRDEAYTDDDYSVPLSAAELAIIKDRDRRIALSGDAKDWADSQVTSGGSWVDGSRDGLIVYQFTDGITEAERELDRLLPDDVDFYVRQVDLGIRDLRKLKDEISRQVTELEKDGIEITAIGLDVRRNVVSVGVDGDVARAQGILQDRFGDGVQVEQEEVAMADPVQSSRRAFRSLPGLPLSIGGDCRSPTR